MRRYSKPRKDRKVKLPPFARSTFSLFSSFISTLSLTNSSRSRFSHRPYQPDMLRMGVDQYHHVIRKSCVLNTGIWLLSGGLNRLLQHPIYLIEIEVTEQRRNHSTLGNSLLPRNQLRR